MNHRAIAMVLFVRPSICLSLWDGCALVLI